MGTREEMLPAEPKIEQFLSDLPKGNLITSANHATAR
jgi:hypothetical protein